jgi:hypothetical protein
MSEEIVNPENRIVQVKLSLQDGNWLIEVKKEFAPDYGGGHQIFKQMGGTEIHGALQVAASMVTLTPTYNKAGRSSPWNCPGCGAAKGWVDANPAKHEQDCGGVGKDVWERKGIQL